MTATCFGFLSKAIFRLT